ncbi:hypothetical protein RchiOBHm_Chr1g0370571 [Rosa chinensis]|uniref:Uncharacterized protein n=1 Tax=Rosa chinensis TaxID=74649 RepID=A0A2P6SLC4_ROSCH|nr:hypothetical protein RchiOBHm_Chr1g0370571 [Rosa chinensis]
MGNTCLYTQPLSTSLTSHRGHVACPFSQGYHVLFLMTVMAPRHNLARRPIPQDGIPSCLLARHLSEQLIVDAPLKLTSI